MGFKKSLAVAMARKPTKDEVNALQRERRMADAHRSHQSDGLPMKDWSSHCEGQLWGKVTLKDCCAGCSFPTCSRSRVNVQYKWEV